MSTANLHVDTVVGGGAVAADVVVIVVVVGGGGGVVVVVGIGDGENVYHPLATRENQRELTTHFAMAATAIKILPPTHES